MKPDLTIVIPAFNEAIRLKKSTPYLRSFLENLTCSWEVILIDDGSRDGTGKKFLEYFHGQFCRVVTNDTNRGKGYSVRRGIAESLGSLVLITDADFSTPLNDYYKLKAALEKGYDIAIGSRSLPGSNVTLHQAWYRENMGRSFNLLVKAIVMDDFIDTQCGFKLFPGEVARRIAKKMTVDRFSFDVEFLYIAKRQGLKTAEIPVEWHNVLESRVRLAIDAPKMLFDLFCIRLNGLFGKYD